MPFFKSKNASTDEHARSGQESLEILLDHEYVFLRGTGVDVEPARLSGNVALYLTEPTTIRSITLQFRGKAYLPVPPQDQHSSSNPPSTYVLCKHNWSFLEGQKKHSYTLKAGRHLFPFQLQVGGSLPCSVITDAFGGASVTYKLRAVVQRTGAFSHNIQAVTPVYLLRSLGPTALEYQQTRDLEHAWMHKLMFSVAIPHSAWAAGDEFVALLKISPLVKGVGVLSVTTSLREMTKVYGRANALTRTVASVTHEIIGGKAVEMREPVEAKGKHPQFSLPHPLRSSSTPSTSEAGPSSSANSSSSNVSNLPQPPTDPAQSEDDVVTSLLMRIPHHLAPSHTLDPIKVTHSIHWSRGHTRNWHANCSLADQKFPSETSPDTNELPSYIAHVRDRVANMFLPEAQTMRVTNPWVRMGVSPILGDQPQHNNATPLEVISDTNNPYIPDPNNPVFLDWVNAELLISQGATKLARPGSCNEERDPSASTSTDDGGTHTPGSDHPPTPPTPSTTGITTYTHTSTASRALPQLLVATMEPTSALTHPHWLGARPDPKDPRASSVDVQRRVKEISVSRPQADSILLHKAFTEVPDYEIALMGFLGGVPPLSSMQGLPSYDEASRSGTPDLGAKRGEGSSASRPGATSS
ncbi:Arrestin-C domain-containing protein [Mycena venus]|uniref:Arrestin-C domain-containing protein n=1 Tax=Mycena venus TaxID=2733690 RepID=A0A8H6YEQ3_9AGAR|nr:Arrestin-C domain-containing protein [Mycena venus]